MLIVSDDCDVIFVRTYNRIICDVDIISIQDLGLDGWKVEVGYFDGSFLLTFVQYGFVVIGGVIVGDDLVAYPLRTTLTTVWQI